MGGDPCADAVALADFWKLAVGYVEAAAGAVRDQWRESLAD
jgi:hypothetical protein